MISDLAGTTWLINETPTLSVTSINELYYLQGKELISTSNGTSHSRLMPSGFSAAVGLYYDNFGVFEPVYTPTGGWVDEAYRTISITGGSDATYSFFISWLEANATQIIRLPNKFVIDGVTKLDLTSDTVEMDKLFYGYTAHDASGATITGTVADGNALLYGSSSCLIGTAEIGTGYVWTSTVADFLVAGRGEVDEYAAA